MDPLSVGVGIAATCLVGGLIYWFFGNKNND